MAGRNRPETAGARVVWCFNSRQLVVATAAAHPHYIRTHSLGVTQVTHITILPCTTGLGLQLYLWTCLYVCEDRQPFLLLHVHRRRRIRHPRVTGRNEINFQRSYTDGDDRRETVPVEHTRGRCGTRALVDVRLLWPISTKAGRAAEKQYEFPLSRDRLFLLLS